MMRIYIYVLHAGHEYTLNNGVYGCIGHNIKKTEKSEKKMKSFSCQWKLIFISLMYLTLHYNNNDYLQYINSF